MDNKTIRLLKAEEIECRVGMINEKGLSLLLYKDARVDQRILDEVFGIFGWKRTHQCIDGNLYCTVEILNKETGEWIAKQDVGTTSYTEKEKGQASDSFKRACFNIGVGRELYSAPFIWISADKTTIQKKGEKYYVNDSFFVSKITYNEQREITGLTIVNGVGKVVYEKTVKKSVTKEAQNKTGNDLKQKLKAELERTGVEMQTVLERYHIKKEEELTPAIYEKALNGLKKTKDKNAA